ncbi:unnamed protein product [Toxocara canis]|uniref:GRIP domain-containing protein n=1 Tax=Toxocara canis TaxID=6265 RepID=A0A183UUY0_TOXCA|nr:unnamed protein product [Toxocara canis]
MSAELVRASAPPSGTATPRSKCSYILQLDSLSREDLIRFVKKQVENVKLLKAENAKLTEQYELTSKAFQDAEEEWKKKLDEAKLESIGNIELIATLREMANREKLFEETEEVQQSCAQPFSNINEEERLRNELKEVNGTVEEQRKEMRALKDLFKEQTEKLLKAEKRNEELICTVDELRSSLDDTNVQLNVIKERQNVENVFSLELDDYEKSLEKIQKELKLTREECASLTAELEKARNEGDEAREEKQRLSNNLTKMKAAIVKLKAELDEKKEQINELQAEKKRLDENIEKLNDERNEEKMEFSAAIGTAEEKIRQLEAGCSSLNRQLVSLRSQRETLQRQYDDLAQEHSTFKTRALYVLEQKKGDESQPKKDEIEMLEQTIEQQKKTIENLTQSHHMAHEELCSNREQLLALSAQLQTVEHQLRSANDAHKRSLSEQRTQYESRLAAETKLNSELLAQIDANFLAHSREKGKIVENAKKERDAISAEMEILKRALEDETRRRKEAERNRSPANIVVPSRRKEGSLIEVNSSFLQRPQSAEEQHEGVDEDETERTLEDVLYGDESNIAVSATREGWQSLEEVKNWEQIAINAHRQLEHTRELLNESEECNVRLSEQSKLLKEEIRRLERNEQRGDHVANSEYLKNVILKFIAPEKVNCERGQLIPVLATMLRLSADEIALLNKIAQGWLSSSILSAKRVLLTDGWIGANSEMVH